MSTADNTKKEHSTDGISSQRLNLILAICGIVIALASFYATYLQAEAADKQVKAMTMPLIQFEHGNHDSSRDIRAITFSLTNSGMGPALIKSVAYKYQGKRYATVRDFYNACCRPVDLIEQPAEQVKTPDDQRPKTITSELLNAMLAGQSSQMFLGVQFKDNNPKFWNKLNKARWSLNVDICYCSMLDECYTTEKKGVIEPIEGCPILDEE